ncbi:glycosyltransferase family 4 protein [Pendulispora albinea]|uniref:Glycosyltransferase family 4 protein n=1 Tax=Pendulispora albinea TaxID=2741071 RepID=A0ABZ2LLS0_9BACT
MPLRILFLNPGAILGGAERVLLDLIASVRALAPEVHVGLVVGAPGPLVDAVRAHGAEVHVVPLPDRLAGLGDSHLGSASPFVRLRMARGAKELAAYASRLRKVIRTFEPSVIHTHGIKMHLLAAAVRPRAVPLVWHVHDFLGARPVSARFFRLGQRRADLAIANSRAVAEDTRKLAPELEVRVMYNGIDEATFSPDGPRAPLDAWAGMEPLDRLGPGALRVGLIATYARWKGHEVFLDAIARLAERTDLPPIRFYIIGGPVYATGNHGQYSNEELRALAEARGIASRVAFVPFQEHPQSVYRALDMVVHASTRPEPFGMIIVEAMATARPVIVSHAGGAAELYRDGVDGVGAPPGDAARLAESIARLAEDASLRQKLGQAARLTAESRFSRERLGAELLAIYSDLFTRYGSVTGLKRPRLTKIFQ